MTTLDSKAAFLDRMKQLKVEEALQEELCNSGFETYGALAFAVSTTPQQITDTVMDEWIKKLTARDLSSFQISCLRRLVVESHALALNDLQRKVDQPSDPLLAHRKLPETNETEGTGGALGRLDILSRDDPRSCLGGLVRHHVGTEYPHLDQTGGVH